MKHDWECVRQPYKDKVADQNWHDLTRVQISCNQFTYENERVVLVPGVYVCKNCGYIQSCCFPPLDSWNGVVGDIPFCADEVVRSVQDE